MKELPLQTESFQCEIERGTLQIDVKHVGVICQAEYLPRALHSGAWILPRVLPPFFWKTRRIWALKKYPLINYLFN